MATRVEDLRGNLEAEYLNVPAIRPLPCCSSLLHVKLTGCGHAGCVAPTGTPVLTANGSLPDRTLPC